MKMQRENSWKALSGTKPGDLVWGGSSCGPSRMRWTTFDTIPGLEHRSLQSRSVGIPRVGSRSRSSTPTCLNGYGSLLSPTVGAGPGIGRRGGALERARCASRAFHTRRGAYLEKNPIIATALNPVLGYANVADLVKQSLKENRSVVDVIVDNGLMPRDEVEKILDVRALTEPTGS